MGKEAHTPRRGRHSPWRRVAKLLKHFYRRAAPEGEPAFVLYVQTFGDLVTFQPHVHALVADGVFLPSGTFQVLPALPEGALTQVLREAVLNLLQEHQCITAEFVERLLAWRHSGFSVHNRVRVKAADTEGRKQLARDMIRADFALEKTSSSCPTPAGSSWYSSMFPTNTSTWFVTTGTTPTALAASGA